MGVTKGEYGKPDYLHAVVKITEEQDKILAERIEEYLKETGEEYISNDDHWRMTFEVLEDLGRKIKQICSKTRKIKRSPV